MYCVVMAVGAVLLVSGLGVSGTRLARGGAARLTPAMRRALALGLWLSCVLTLVTAGVLSSGTSHFVGTPWPDAATLPLLGWSAEVGDLRPAHFLALHAMQALPLAPLLAERLAPAGALRFVGIAAALWVALTAAVFAVAGCPATTRRAGATLSHTRLRPMASAETTL
ncbi:hypothetical protein DLJ49_18500 [Rhodovulum sp. 12E13]|uniref:hypothetical protein n=1 Tax=Rhodovulum sp. 12E13 TaxID=2203891 RepID=UPI000E1AADCD|nr:hypothetical protein [Rhodovulum sp. 12E13]RDC69737.1 hypothetical protein DLJ49_18500 [Rhodovulum sp. 12E13]